MFRFLSFSLLCWLLASPILSAQSRTCATDDVLARQIDRDPTRAIRLSTLDRQIGKFASVARPKELLTIPVVVHVVHRRPVENIGYEQIASQLAVLNEDYRRLNADVSNRWAQAADTEIEFCLASVDPLGRPTTGIVRQTTSVNGFGTSDRVKDASRGGSSAWPAAEYLNIWVCNIGGTVLGYAQLPAGDPATDGVVIDYRYFGTSGTAVAPFDGGRTTVHEVGHYLNLRHPWGEGGCDSDDGVADTPPTDGPSYGCPPDGFRCDHATMTQNFMEYTHDACMNLFTTGQRERMLAAIAIGRPGLLTSNGCGTPTNLDTTAVDDVTTPDDCERFAVQLDVSTDNFASETSWSLRDAGGTVVAEAGGFRNLTTSSEVICLDTGCYVLTMADSYGDGMCCSYGNGSFRLNNLSDATKIGTGGTFRFEETVEFCLGTENEKPGDGQGGGEPNCDDGLRNGDETGVDCGGASCVPCGPNNCTPVALTEEGFEWGYGLFNDGGSDCYRIRSQPATGIYSIRLRDNSNTSVLTSDPLDLSDYVDLELAFSYVTVSMEAGEDFWIQIDRGEGFEAIADYIVGRDFENEERQSVELVIPGPFSPETFVRFRCDASSNNDYVYLDDIRLSVCETAEPARRARPLDIAPPPLTVYPNPASRYAVLDLGEASATIDLLDVDGRIVESFGKQSGLVKTTIHGLPTGLYYFRARFTDGRPASLHRLLVAH